MNSIFSNVRDSLEKSSFKTFFTRVSSVFFVGVTSVTLLSLFLSFLVKGSPGSLVALYNPFALLISLGSIIFVSYSFNKAIYARNLQKVRSLYYVLLAFWCYFLVPTFVYIPMNIIAVAMFTASCFFGVCSLFGFYTKRSLEKLGDFASILFLGVFVSCIFMALFSAFSGVALTIVHALILFSVGALTACMIQKMRSIYLSIQDSTDEQILTYYCAMCFIDLFITAFRSIAHLMYYFEE